MKPRSGPFPTEADIVKLFASLRELLDKGEKEARWLSNSLWGPDKIDVERVRGGNVSNPVLTLADPDGVYGKRRQRFLDGVAFFRESKGVMKGGIKALTRVEATFPAPELKPVDERTENALNANQRKHRALKQLRESREAQGRRLDRGEGFGSG